MKALFLIFNNDSCKFKEKPLFIGFLQLDIYSYTP